MRNEKVIERLDLHMSRSGMACSWEGWERDVDGNVHAEIVAGACGDKLKPIFTYPDLAKGPRQALFVVREGFLKVVGSYSSAKTLEISIWRIEEIVVSGPSSSSPVFARVERIAVFRATRGGGGKWIEGYDMTLVAAVEAMESKLKAIVPKVVWALADEYSARKFKQEQGRASASVPAVQLKAGATKGLRRRGKRGGHNRRNRECAEIHSKAGEVNLRGAELDAALMDAFRRQSEEWE